MTEQLLGRSINRLEDERFVQGRGCYIADLSVPDALHGVASSSARRMRTRASSRSMSMRRFGYQASRPFSPDSIWLQTISDPCLAR